MSSESKIGKRSSATPKHGGSNHFMCERCWNRGFEEQGRTPLFGVRYRPPHKSRCCFCGEPTEDAIPYGEPITSARLVCADATTRSS